MLACDQLEGGRLNSSLRRSRELVSNSSLRSGRCCGVGVSSAVGVGVVFAP
jgi:hypothetical protein